MGKVDHTQIGCELFLRKGDSILLGKRKNCFGAGTWALPGGHLEFNERLVDAACREAHEEMGITIAPEQLKLVSVVDGVEPEGDTHYVHATFELRDADVAPVVMEPEYCEEWRYFQLNDLPDNFFPPHKAIVENYLQQVLYKY